MTYLIKVCVPNKIEDLNLSVFNIITQINEQKTLARHISCGCICRFDRRKCNSVHLWNNNKCWCECKKRQIWEKDYVWNPATCNCEYGKRLASIMGDSTIVRDEITKPYNEDVEAKSYKEKKIDEKKVTRKMQNFFRYIFINYYSIIDTC